MVCQNKNSLHSRFVELAFGAKIYKNKINHLPMEEELISEMEIEQCGEMKNQSDRKKTKKKQNRKAKPPKEPVACKYCGLFYFPK